MNNSQSALSNPPLTNGLGVPNSLTNSQSAAKPKRWDRGLREATHQDDETAQKQQARLRLLQGHQRSTKPLPQRIRILREHLQLCLDIGCKGQIIDDAKHELYKDESKLKSYALSGLAKSMAGQDLADLQNWVTQCLNAGISDEDNDVVKAQEMIAAWKTNPSMLTTKIAQKQKKELQQQLFTAAKQSDIDTIVAITQKVANWPQMRDPTGRSLIDVARSRENQELVQLLQNLQAEALPTKRQLRSTFGGPQLPRPKDFSPKPTASSPKQSAQGSEKNDISNVAVSLGSDITQRDETTNLNNEASGSEPLARQLECSPKERANSVRESTAKVSNEKSGVKKMQNAVERIASEAKPEPTIGSSAARILARQRARASPRSFGRASASPSPAKPVATSSPYVDKSKRGQLTEISPAQVQEDICEDRLQTAGSFCPTDPHLVLETREQTNSPREAHEASHRPKSKSGPTLETNVQLPKLRPIDPSLLVQMDPMPSSTSMAANSNIATSGDDLKSASEANIARKSKSQTKDIFPEKQTLDGIEESVEESEKVNRKRLSEPKDNESNANQAEEPASEVPKVPDAKFGQHMLTSGSLRANTHEKFELRSNATTPKVAPLSAMGIRGDRVKEAVIGLETGQKTIRDYGVAKVIECDGNATPTSSMVQKSSMLPPQSNTNSGTGSSFKGY